MVASFTAGRAGHQRRPTTREGKQAMSEAEAAASPPEPERAAPRSEEHTSELQSLMRISYAVFCLKKTNRLQSDNRQINATTAETNAEPTKTMRNSAPPFASNNNHTQRQIHQMH